VAADRELGLALARLGDTTRAIERLERLTQARPREDENWRALGFAYSTAGRRQQAETVLRHAIALPPRRALEHRDLGVLLGALGKPDEARQEYRKALALDDREASVWFNLGNLEARAGRPEPALDAYRKAEARDSTAALAIQGQLAMLDELGRQEERGATFRRWLRLRPDDHNARLEAVRHFNAQLRPDIALEIARDGLRQNRGSPDARMILGIAYQFAGHTREALTELRRSQRQFGSSVGAARAEEMVATLRRSAPDSLRALFAADSVAAAARADSLRSRARDDSTRAVARADSLRRIGRIKP
jgi:tetratricopeptide (TPR) repeat protein